MFDRLIKFAKSVFGRPSPTPEDHPVRVLFIGNSYTHMNEMPEMVQKLADAAGLNAYIDKSAQSGASFKIHSERKEMYEAIQSRKWDYIILQGYSRELTHSEAHIDKATIPYLDKIVAFIRKHNPATRVLFYMTWGYESGFSERGEINTFEKMTDTIQDRYMYLSSVYDFPVSPVGCIWKHVKETTSIDLYADDRAHPSRKGSFLIANAFFEAIFGIPAPTGVSMIDLQEAEQIRESVKHVMKDRSRYLLDRMNVTPKK